VKRFAEEQQVTEEEEITIGQAFWSDTIAFSFAVDETGKPSLTRAGVA